MSGWVGKFVSYAPTGAGEDDVRFQDIWLRAFQERGSDGCFHMKMIRQADQEAKSWPRAGALCTTFSTTLKPCCSIQLLNYRHVQ